MSTEDSPRFKAIRLLREASTCGLRGKNRQAVLDCLHTLEDDGRGDLKEMTYRQLAVGRTLRDPARPGFQFRRRRDCGVWHYRYSDLETRQQKELKIGNDLEMTLAQARDQWQILRKKRLAGENPAEIENTDKAPEMTVRELFEKYLELASDPETGKKSWRTDHQLIERDFMVPWGDRPAASITAEDARELVLPIWSRGSPRTAEKVVSLGRFAWNVAMAKGRKGAQWHMLSGETKAWGGVKENPFTSVALPDRESRSDYLREGQLRSFIQRLPDSAIPEGIQQVLLFQLMTGARISE